MGIKNFSKTFSKFKVVPMTKYSGKRIAVDAMTEIYRAALGMKNPHTLTDESGNPTGHITVIINNISKFLKLNISQIWVFDSSEADPAKAMEDAKRSEQKKKAEIRKKKMIDELFSEDDEEESETKKTKLEKIEKLEKQTFRINEKILSDVFRILDGFGITYLISPAGIQAECVCAALTRIPESSADYKMLKCDAVLSPDTDSLLFGAVKVLKRIRGNQKELEEYKLESILKKYDITQKELVKIGIVLGCDFYKDTDKLFSGIGPAKVFEFVKKSEKFKSAFKQDGPQVAYKVFRSGHKDFAEHVKNAKKVYSDMSEAGIKKNRTGLLDWLVKERGFKESLWQKRVFV